MRTLVILLALSIPAHAQAEDLGTFLRDATAAMRASTVLRASGTLTSTGENDPVEKKFVLLLSPQGHVLIDFGKTDERVLVPASGSDAYRRAADRDAADRVPLSQALLGTDITLEDLRPFDTARFGSPIIADRNERQVTVSLDPRDSQYALIVSTFERKRKIQVKTMYYIETLNNLVKMRRDQQFAQVGGAWVPGAVSMEDFKLRTTTGLSLVWSEAPGVEAAYFAPSSFAAAPALR